MPKLAAPLTDIQPRNAKGRDKPYKLADGGGLYLLVNPDGAKYWRLDYRFADVRRTLAFGKYPLVSLAEARDKRTAARKLIDAGIDPGQDKKEKARIAAEKNAHTFEKLAREWHANKLPTWRGSTAKDTLRRLEIDIFPEIGSMPIGSITHQHMIAALRKIETRGAVEVAHRVKDMCAHIQLRQSARHREPQPRRRHERRFEAGAGGSLCGDHGGRIARVPGLDEYERCAAVQAHADRPALDDAAIPAHQRIDRNSLE